jgi:hypothetical protein
MWLFVNLTVNRDFQIIQYWISHILLYTVTPCRTAAVEKLRAAERSRDSTQAKKLQQPYSQINPFNNLNPISLQFFSILLRLGSVF